MSLAQRALTIGALALPLLFLTAGSPQENFRHGELNPQCLALLG
jgi:hypothetical protein